jgi:hypothetical protein
MAFQRFYLFLYIAAIHSTVEEFCPGFQGAVNGMLIHLLPFLRMAASSLHPPDPVTFLLQTGMYLLIPFSRTSAILLGGNERYSVPKPTPPLSPTPRRRPLMPSKERPDGTLSNSGTGPVSGVEEKLNVPSDEWCKFLRFNRIPNCWYI